MPGGGQATAQSFQRRRGPCSVSDRLPGPRSRASVSPPLKELKELGERSGVGRAGRRGPGGSGGRTRNSRRRTRFASAAAAPGTAGEAAARPSAPVGLGIVAGEGGEAAFRAEETQPSPEAPPAAMAAQSRKGTPSPRSILPAQHPERPWPLPPQHPALKHVLSLGLWCFVCFFFPPSARAWAGAARGRHPEAGSASLGWTSRSSLM